jgi:GT2 family glycosyltransferase
MSKNLQESLLVSVCICTRNRPVDLKNALDSLNKSTYPIFEVIVSDDSTNNETEVLVKDKYPSVKYLSGPRRGLGANRNNAIKAVNGSHLLFIDDDVILGERFLEIAFNHIEAHVKSGDDINKVIVTGPQLDHGRLMFPHDQDFLGYQVIPYKEGQLLKTVVINSAIFPAKIFETVLFDDKLVYGCDEVDFTTRAVKAGYKIILAREAINNHFPSLVNRDFYKPYHEASRLYVTFKRYLSTENHIIKAFIYLIIAAFHTIAHTFKMDGIGGIQKALKTFGIVFSYVYGEYFTSGSNSI